jgi:hypothetical protein
MAAISPTVGNVTPIGNSNTTVVVQAGETITQLEAVYQKSTDGLYWRAVSSSSIEKAELIGVAVTTADAQNDWFIVMTAGVIDPGATVVVGTEYVLGGVDGEIEPRADAASGDHYVRVGYGTAATSLVIDIAVGKDNAATPANVVYP